MPRRQTPRELAVWANGLRVGTWRLPSRSAMEFQYHSDWLSAVESRPLSLSLPLTGHASAHAHRGAAVEAYFDNLLPESESIRRRLQQRHHTASRGAFDLLAAIGRDCVGAVQILPADEDPPDIRRIEARPLSETAIAAELAGITSPALAQAEDDDFRISIAGAQEKTALLRHLGRWCRPVGSTPTTHIFKLPLGLVGNRQADLRTSVENEWLCSRILQAFGVPVAACEIGEFSGQKVLIVERFDRQLHSSGRFWLRLMQEDFAQATGTPWHRKYQSDGGPGIEDIARILRGAIDALTDLTTLFRAQVLFYLLAATDGHAKNFSIRILPGGRFQLTPLYDVLSTWPVIGRKANEIPLEKVKLAMAIPGQRPHYLLKSLHRRHFEALGRKLGLGPDAGKLLEQMVESVGAVIATVEKQLPRGFPSSLADRVFEGLARNAKALLARPAHANH
jgi:serine/threonine-protein kinase HipA